MASHTQCQHCGCQSGSYIRALEEKIRRLEAAQANSPPSPPSSALFDNLIFRYEVPANAQTKSDWKTTEVRELENLTPKFESDWTRRRKDVQLSKPKDILTAFLQLVSCAQVQVKPKEPLSSQDVGTRRELLDSYRKFSMHLQEGGERQTQLANLSSFLYICLCRVAATTKALEVEAIDEDMRKTMGGMHQKRSDSSSSHLRKLRASVQWPLGQARRLRERGLENRADELFVISMFTLSR